MDKRTPFYALAALLAAHSAIAVEPGVAGSVLEEVVATAKRPCPAAIEEVVVTDERAVEIAVERPSFTPPVWTPMPLSIDSPLASVVLAESDRAEQPTAVVGDTGERRL